MSLTGKRYGLDTLPWWSQLYCIHHKRAQFSRGELNFNEAPTTRRNLAFAVPEGPPSEEGSEKAGASVGCYHRSF